GRGGCLEGGQARWGARWPAHIFTLEVAQVVATLEGAVNAPRTPKVRTSFQKDKRQPDLS
ncbi:hypothetical protein, partial [Deinococcus frigens]|uniref:hypothetical protein n=1 Tax=Deinococcus frigens TaxID=249403 RepID=UPI0039EDFBEE